MTDAYDIDDDEWETPCPKREDKIHCVHWYDAEPCCNCGDDTWVGVDNEG